MFCDTVAIPLAIAGIVNSVITALAMELELLDAFINAARIRT
jgi:cation transport ATPase